MGINNISKIEIKKIYAPKIRTWEVQPPIINIEIDKRFEERNFKLKLNN